MEIKASVREIAEMVYGSGDLAGEEYLRRRAEEGILIHKEHQSRYQEGDQREVYVSYEEAGEDYRLFLSGRIDGVLKRGKKTIIEEIKSTTRDLAIVNEETVPAHLAQAKLYAFIYFRNSRKRKIDIRLTYIRVKSKEIKKIDLVFSKEEIEDFFRKTIELYIGWLRKISAHEERRNRSIEGLVFPFPDYREGQRDLMGACYRTLLNKGILYAIAPTGIGKTVAVLFSALKTINRAGQKLFYLTAKNLGKRIVMDTVKLLMAAGLKAKTVEITAKDSICFLEERDCDPEKCPYARDYYTKLFPALQDIFLNADFYDRETIALYAAKHGICPFEYSLDISNFSDIIVADYNYAFCPRTHLTRYFDEGSVYEPMLLIDEAHNLVSRSQDMYSGEASKAELLTLRKLLGENKISTSLFADVLKYFEEYEREMNPGDFFVRDLNEEFVGAVQK
ncbi:MAG TPA: ATP-dependent DNA helicase, partial [Acholeplasmataceae bacterium]|nr:ATP-dependent DNA helicase [Acholeplasmataceae bacterium]